MKKNFQFFNFFFFEIIFIELILYFIGQLLSTMSRKKMRFLSQFFSKKSKIIYEKDENYNRYEYFKHMKCNKNVPPFFSENIFVSSKKVYIPQIDQYFVLKNNMKIWIQKSFCIKILVPEIQNMHCKSIEYMHFIN